MDNTTLILVAIIAVSVVAGLFILLQLFKSNELRKRFGPEYEAVVDKYQDKREAEKELEEREKRVSQYKIRSLTPEEHDHFAKEWHAAQAHFVDRPSEAVTEVDKLLNEVIEIRGYPVADFEQHAADLSVDYSTLVKEYRNPHDIEMANAKGKASTEDLRRAMISYRSLFEELVNDGKPTEKTKREMENDLSSRN